MSDDTAKTTRYTDHGVKVTITRNDAEPAFTLSFTENPTTPTFEGHAPVNTHEGKHNASSKHSSDHSCSKKGGNHSNHHGKSHDQKGSSHSLLNLRITLYWA